MDHATWFHVVAAIYNLTAGSDDGKTLAHEFSQRGGSAYNAKRLNKTWEGLGSEPERHKVGLVYLKTLLSRNAPTHPIDPREVSRWRTMMLDAICHAHPKANRAIISGYSDEILAEMYQKIPRRSLPKRNKFDLTMES